MRFFSIIFALLCATSVASNARQSGVGSLEDIGAMVVEYRQDHGLPDGSMSKEAFDAMFSAVTAEFSTIWIAGSNKIMLCLGESLSYLDRFGVSNHTELPVEFQRRALGISELSDAFGPGGGAGYDPDPRLTALMLLMVVDSMNASSSQIGDALSEFHEAKDDILSSYSAGMGQRFLAIDEMDCLEPGLGEEIRGFRSERGNFANLVGARLAKTIPLILGGAN